jgi:integrase
VAKNLIKGDTTIKSIKPGDARKRLTDGDGLYLLPFVNGGSHGWRFDYSHEGRRKTLSLGTYPSTGLSLARQQAETARQLVAAGVDPSAERKAKKARAVEKRERDRRADEGLPPLDSFEHVARAWYETRRHEWAASYGSKIIRRLELDVFPYIGAVPAADITPPALLQVLRRIEARGVIETAHRALEECSQVFRFAVASGSATSNPARDLNGALKKATAKNFPAILDPGRFGELLRAIHGYQGTVVVRAALQLAPMLLLRPGELRFANWAEIDLDGALWTVPAARMKRTLQGKTSGKAHLVPLPRQAVAALRDLYPLTGPDGFVFRGERHHDRAMSENTVNAALRAMGFPKDEVTGHGFRATARTMLDEVLARIFHECRTG